MNPEDRLREIAGDCAHKAAYWRGKFNFLGWVNVASATLFLPLALLCLTDGLIFVAVLGVLLIGISMAALFQAWRCFREAKRSFNNYMQLRQECLEAIDILRGL